MELFFSLIWNYNYLVQSKKMDLDYPSQKKHDLSKEVQRLDRRFGSIILSNPKIEPIPKALPSWIKHKLFYFIKKDYSAHLLFFMEKEAINIRDRIGDDNLSWNILHYCAKHNAHRCVLNLLRNLYQEEPKQYEGVINSKTEDGDTPLLIACQHISNDVIECLLEGGCIDLYAINIRKVMAYQIAFSTNNQEALKLLMKYEVKVKQKSGINLQYLSKPVIKQKQSFCPGITKCFLRIFGFKKKDQEGEPEQTDRKLVNQNMKSCNSQIISGLPEVCWLEPEIVFSKKISLFTSLSSPFSIKQSNIIVSNLLITFQSLAYYPELLRSIIFKVNDYYQVHLWKSQNKTIITIDPVFPFYKHSNEPLFLSLNEELWPMVLQKALCQMYNGFFEAGKVPIEDLLETITSNIPYKMKLDHDTPKIDLLLAQFETQNFMHMLKPSPKSIFTSQQGRVECFQILKRWQGKYLINCPFIFPEGKKKQAKETKEMKLQKVHYLNPNTSTVWVSQSQLYDSFEQIVFCPTNAPQQFNCNRKIKCDTTNTNCRFYISVKLPRKTTRNPQTSSSDSVQHNKGLNLDFKVKQLLDHENKIIEYEQSIMVSKAIGWTLLNRRNTNKINKIEKIPCSMLGRVSIPVGEVYSECFLQITIDLSQHHENLNSYLNNEFPQLTLGEQIKDRFIQQLFLYSKSDQYHELENVDLFVGDLEFIECCKNYFNNHLNDFEGPIIETIGDYLLVLVPTDYQCYIEFQSGIQEDEVIEGSLQNDGKKLDLIEFDHIHYGVLLKSSGVSEKKLNIFGLEEVETAESNLSKPESEQN